MGRRRRRQAFRLKDIKAFFYLVFFWAIASALIWIGQAITAPFGIKDELISLLVGAGIVLIIFLLVAYLRWARQRRLLRLIDLSGVDKMGGLEFEAYVCELLRAQGYKAKNIQGSGDFGVDIVAEKGDLKYAIQVKRYKRNVSRKALSDAVAGKDFLGCNAAMVVTNSYFTKKAKEFARSTHCELVDRDTLAQWIEAYQKGS